MKIFKSLLFGISILFSMNAVGQMIEDPANWTYEVKKKSGNDYQLIFHMALKPGWHIWSMQPGGDGYQIATSFTFDKNPAVKMKGKMVQKGKATTTNMDMIKGKVTYYSGNVDYVQEVTVTGKTKLTGKHEYQACNDKLCLPPKERDFSFEIN